VDGAIFNVVWNLKKRGYSDRTLKGYLKRLKFLAKNVNIDDPNAVSMFLASMKVSDAYKEGIVNAYVHYVREYGLVWDKPKYKRDDRLPYVPSTEEVNMIIAHAGRKYSMIFPILRDTGLRPVELQRLTLKNIDLDKGLLYPATAKGGRGRILRLKSSTLAMLKEYVSKHNFSLNERIFPDTDVVSHVFMRIRNRLAQRLHRPEFKKIKIYSLRHYFACRLYHQTKDLVYVMGQMGHRRIQTTMRYVQLMDFKDNEYVSAVASSIKEAQKLIECGFEHVTNFEDKILFRKRK